MGIILLVKFRRLPSAAAPPEGRLQNRVAEKKMSRRCASWVGKVEEERERQTAVQSPGQRSCGARFKAGMGQISKVLDFCHPLLSPPTFPGERRRRDRKKKSEVVRREGMRRVERKGRRKARHTAVFGLEWSSGKHVTVPSCSPARPFTFLS